MLWGIILLVTCVLLVVLFHKPSVNTAGVSWVPPQQRQPAAPNAQVTAEGSGAVQQPVAPAPQTPDTFDFNDLFKGQPPAGPTDRSST